MASDSANNQRIQRVTRYGTEGQCSFRGLSSSGWREWREISVLENGVVPVAKGGTGVTSLTSLMTALFPTDANPPTYIPVFGSGWNSRGYVTPSVLRQNMNLGPLCTSTSKSADELLEIGYYVTKTGMPDTNWWYVHTVANYANVAIIQEAYLLVGTSVTPYAAQKITRTYYSSSGNGNGVWCPWEWVNPVMTLGKEYRTTERHDGKPVYKKLIKHAYTTTIGSDSGYTDSVISVGTTMTACVSINARAVENNTEFKLPYLESAGGTTMIMQCTSAGILVRTWHMTWTKPTFYIEIAYTKD